MQRGEEREEEREERKKRRERKKSDMRTLCNLRRDTASRSVWLAILCTAGYLTMAYKSYAKNSPQCTPRVYTSVL